MDLAMDLALAMVMAMVMALAMVMAGVMVMALAMANYVPMSREQLLANGNCCTNGCVHCPWRLPKIHEPINIDPRIEAALRSGETMTIHSDRMSLVPQLTIQNLTIIYRKYEPTHQSN
jgi:hypothetical protein